MRAGGPGHRCRGTRGAGTVLALITIAGSLGATTIWLSGEVDRATSLGTTARIIAFEAARVGARHVDIEALRRATDDTVTVEPDEARPAVVAAVRSELARRGLTGEVSGIAIDGDEVGVAIVIEYAGRRIPGEGRARAVIGP